MVALTPLSVFTTLPVLPPPEPENVLAAVFGDMLRVSPKLTVPELLLILTAPMTEGKGYLLPPVYGSSRNRWRMFTTRVSNEIDSFEPMWTTEAAAKKGTRTFRTKM